MKFDIMTLFPEMVSTVLYESVIGRAIKAGIIEAECHNIRDYSENKHRNVDDTPYGGGMGMVMAAPPIYNCYAAIKEKNGDKYKSVHTVYMSPKGQVLTQKKAEELKEYDIDIIFTAQHVDLRQVSAITKNVIVTAQHMDGIVPGRGAKKREVGMMMTRLGGNSNE